MPLVKDMIVSKFLRKEDLADDEDRVLTIKGVKLEDMPGDQGDQKWVVYFREEAKGMAMNMTTIRVLEQAYGGNTDEWVGNKVKLYVDPNVSFGGKIVGGLRLKTSKKGVIAPKAKVVEPEPEPETQEEDDEFNDSIPF